MHGTLHEHDWVFWHDALSQMTCRSTLEWMKSKDYLRRWVLPEQNLNAGTAFSGRPVGNSPELMCWDCSLIKDVDNAFIRHKAWTMHLPRGSPTKFCSSTPKRLEESYLRLMDPCHGHDAGVPTSDRIIHDAEKCFGDHLMAVINAQGAVVHGLGNRNGKRRESGNGGHGGKREKASDVVGHWLHPDAEAGLVDQLGLVTRAIELSKCTVDVAVV
ncbi:hypothetical protein H257_17802 [Aphanomyces astaci]|uniref:Uncharacterized protein n=1 Tax=Aphanomyces astaci TaxID=112090 RepID=W4FDB6_APHAT|nr:hypothetical protein H257_17802 [Aphanomyces astaci]ETV65465.1 hypothetical protein H257_17802 [Aphanomyces astaci]|eukprot:XP_009845047.1 hypothetical protein H257_17802 [Aphanomyces astaci]